MRAPILVVSLLWLVVRVGAEPLVVAHRGASKDAPENTIPAFELAWKQGADAIEGDFHLTRDGRIVCIHDESTGGVARVDRKVRESTLEELRGIDVGERFGEAWRGTRIPTIADVFETIPDGKKIFIEVKCGPEILPKLFEELRKSGLGREQVVVISFNMKVIYALKGAAPNVEAYWLSNFTKEEGKDLDPSPDQVLKILEVLEADGFSGYGHEALTRGYVDAIRAGGFQYHVWTIDEVDEAKRFRAMGVGSITTNRPGFLRRGMAEGTGDGRAP